MRAARWLQDSSYCLAMMTLSLIWRSGTFFLQVVYTIFIMLMIFAL